MHRLTGVVQHYAWGDERAIPQLLGVEPDGRPWAELWFGTHPAGQATIEDGRLLADVAGPLPYLLKVLAAAEPLSLQAHPSAARAEEGHRLGIYGDPNAKPELLCALTPFDALCGVQPAQRTVAALTEIGANDLLAVLEVGGLAATVADLYRGELDPASTFSACASSAHPAAVLVDELAARYPGDPSVVVTLLLNRVLLEPGEAIHLGPGNLHAYLGGVGIEVMAASDNVVRGGLTVKPVDVDELLTVFDPEPLVDPLMPPTEVASGVHQYAPDGAPFILWELQPTKNLSFAAPDGSGAIVVCTGGGDATLPTGGAVYLAPGEELTLPAGSMSFAATSPRS